MSNDKANPISTQHTFDFSEQVSDVLVVEGQAAAEDRVQDHTARPHVDFGTRVQTAWETAAAAEAESTR